VLSAAGIKKEEKLYTTVKAVKLLCMLMGVSKPTIQGKISEVIYIACILSTVRTKLPF
jgi:hypothetical protein